MFVFFIYTYGFIYSPSQERVRHSVKLCLKEDQNIIYTLFANIFLAPMFHRTTTSCVLLPPDLSYSYFRPPEFNSWIHQVPVFPSLEVKYGVCSMFILLNTRNASLIVDKPKLFIYILCM